MDNEEFLRRFLAYVSKQKLSPFARKVYFCLIENNRILKVETIADKCKIASMSVFDAFSELSDKLLLSGSPDAYHVHIPSLDKNAPKPNVERKNDGLSVLETLRFYYSVQSVYIKDKKRKNSEDFSILRRLCKTYKASVIEEQIKAFFQTGAYKDLDPRGGVSYFEQHLSDLPGLARVREYQS